MENQVTPREQIIEVISHLFSYIDERQWEKLSDEIFSGEVVFDMTSLGAEKAVSVPPETICNLLKDALRNIDATHHQVGNHIIDHNENMATAKVYALIIHYKGKAQNGTTRTFAGTYTLGFTRTESGWRIKAFKYTLKFVAGNTELS